MPRLKDKYLNEILPKLKEEFGIKNNMAVPGVRKIVLNVGAGDIKDDQSILDKILENLQALSGQKAVATKAKKSISTFKLSKGQIIGAMVTLRGARMYNFLDKFIAIVLPKVRDFHGVSKKGFDRQGNYNLGMQEAAIFPEVGFEGSIGNKMRGLAISIVTTSKTREQGIKLLELLGMPFEKG